MKQTLLTLTFLLCATFSIAQELKVKSFIHNEMNLEARVGRGRTDLNGKQCALIKVMVRDNIMKCKGGNVGDIIAEGVVKKIFVSPSSRFLELEFQYNFPLKVTFADYGIPSLAEGGTYTITLVDANMLSQQQLQQLMQQIPQHFSLEIEDNETIEIDSVNVEDIDTTYIDTTSVDTASIEIEDTDVFDTTIVSIEPSNYLLRRIANQINLDLSKVNDCTLMSWTASEMENPFNSKKPTLPPTLLACFISETDKTLNYGYAK